MNFERREGNGMKKLLLCVMLVLMCVSSATGGTVRNYLGELVNVLSSCETDEQRAEKAGEMMTPEKIRAVISSGDDINAKGEYGVTLLMLASGFSNNPETVRLLLNAGADVNAKDDEGFTALIIALGLGVTNNPKIVKLLVDAGADVNVKDKNGRTARDLAEISSNPEIRKMSETLFSSGKMQ